MLSGEPGPPGLSAGVGEVGSAAGCSADLARETSRMRSKVGESDGAAVAERDVAVIGGEGLQWSIETDQFRLHQLDEEVGGKDFAQRAEPEERVGGGSLMGIRVGFAEGCDGCLLVADDHEDEASGTGPEEEVLPESLGRLYSRESLGGGRDGQESEAEETAKHGA